MQQMRRLPLKPAYATLAAPVIIHRGFRFSYTREMVKKRKHYRRSLKRTLRRKWIVGVLVCASVIMIIGSVTLPTDPMINPAAFTPLLDLISTGESGGNYNAYFNHATNHTIQFTSMSIGQVLQWQQTQIEQGSASSAVGRYQFLRSTLADTTARLHLDPATPFSPQVQDQLAIELINERGASSFVEGTLTPEDFAHNLSKEWASLPSVTGASPDNGFYDGDGLNHAHISHQQLLAAVLSFKSAAETPHTQSSH